MPLATHTKKILILLLIILVAGMLIWYGAFAFIRSKSAKASALEAQAEERVASEKRDIALSLLLEDIRPEREALESRFVSSEGAVEFIEKLEALATENHLSRTVGSVTLDVNGEKGSTPAPEGYEWLRLSLTTTGSWKDTYRFLTLLESMPYKLAIGSVSFTAGNKTETVGKSDVVTSVWDGKYSISVLKRK